MSLSTEYFAKGYWMAKTAAKKKKEEGMSTGAKLGLGAAGLGAAGAGAYFSPEILGQAAKLLESNPELAAKLQSGAGWAQENLQDPMSDMASSVAGNAKQLYHNAPAMAQEAGDYLGGLKDSAVGNAKQLQYNAPAMMQRAKEAIMGLGGSN